MKIRSVRTRCCAFLLAVMLLTGAMACGEQSNADDNPLAEYGSYGFSLGRLLSWEHPMRGPFTEEERAVADYLADAFSELGFEPEIDSFTVTDEERDRSLQSQNVVVTIPGTGFDVTNPDTGRVSLERRTVIIGAHYDTWFSVPVTDPETGEPIEPVAGAPYEACVEALALGYDGINGSSSGIGALMAFAEAASNKSFEYDVVLVAFGAGNADHAGARHYAGKMTSMEKRTTDAMYYLEALYGGDKLYASAGLNSLSVTPDGGPAKRYDMRRKLYELTDVAIEHNLASVNVDLYTNQSSLRLDLNGNGTSDIFREVTHKVSGFTPFDEAGIPCVYVESYDYDFDAMDEMRDTKNPETTSFGGDLRKTPRDSYMFLFDLLPEGEIMKNRTSAVAFLLVNAVEKGAWDLVSEEIETEETDT